jgi:hypothetical protein
MVGASIFRFSSRTWKKRTLPGLSFVPRSRIANSISFGGFGFGGF